MRSLFETLPNSSGEYAKVSKNNYGEYVARLFRLDVRGRAIHYAPADCFESDLESACGSALAMVR